MKGPSPQDNYSAYNGYAHLAAGLSCGMFPSLFFVVVCLCCFSCLFAVVHVVVCVGLSGLGAGLAIGIVGDAGVLFSVCLLLRCVSCIACLCVYSVCVGVRANGQVEKLFVPMVLILIFAEVRAVCFLFSLSLCLFSLFVLVVCFLRSQHCVCCTGAWSVRSDRRHYPLTASKTMLNLLSTPQFFSVWLLCVDNMCAPHGVF